MLWRGRAAKHFADKSTKDIGPGTCNLDCDQPVSNLAFSYLSQEANIQKRLGLWLSYRIPQSLDAGFPILLIRMLSNRE